MDGDALMNRHNFISNKKIKPKTIREQNPERDKRLKSQMEPFRKEAKIKMIKVYWGGHRHWLGKATAAKHEAAAILKSQCDCYITANYSSGSPEPEHYQCRYHMMSGDRRNELRDRIAKNLLKKWG